MNAEAKTRYELVPLKSKKDLPSEWIDTPFEKLIAAHNWGQDIGSYDRAELLIGTCIDYRIRIRMPERFAFVMRVAGANLELLKFQVAYAVAVGKVQYVALIAHTGCLMRDLASQKEAFIQGMMDVGDWEPVMAEKLFSDFSQYSEIGEEPDFILKQSSYYEKKYSQIAFAPFIYKVEDNLIYWVKKK